MTEPRPDPDYPDMLSPQYLREIAIGLENQNHEAEQMARLFHGARKNWWRVVEHTHQAGTMIGKQVDECALCGRDLRDGVHKRAKIKRN